ASLIDARKSNPGGYDKTFVMRDTSEAPRQFFSLSIKGEELDCEIENDRAMFSGRESADFTSKIRSTYLAIRSNSRLTRSPGRASRKFVSASVCGMIHTTKLSARTSAMVRL